MRARRFCYPTVCGVAAILLGVAGVAEPVGAQVNIERLRLSRAEEGLSGRLSVSLSSRSGNVDATTLTIGGRSDFVRGPRTLFLVVDGDYAWQGGRQFSDQGLAHLRFMQHLKGRVAAEAFVQGDYNKARLLDARSVGGAGVRVTVVSRERATFALGTAAMAEHEELGLPPGARHPRRTDAWRWSSYATLSWAFNDRSGVTATAYSQPRFDDVGDIRVIAEGALNVKVGGPVSMTLVGALRHDSDPPDGIAPTDTRIVTGFTVSF